MRGRHWHPSGVIPWVEWVERARVRERAADVKPGHPGPPASAAARAGALALVMPAGVVWRARGPGEAQDAPAYAADLGTATPRNDRATSAVVRSPPRRRTTAPAGTPRRRRGVGDPRPLRGTVVAAGSVTAQ